MQCPSLEEGWDIANTDAPSLEEGWGECPSLGGTPRTSTDALAFNDWGRVRSGDAIPGFCKPSYLRTPWADALGLPGSAWQLIPSGPLPNAFLRTSLKEAGDPSACSKHPWQPPKLLPPPSLWAVDPRPLKAPSESSSRRSQTAGSQGSLGPPESAGGALPPPSALPVQEDLIRAG